MTLNNQKTSAFLRRSVNTFFLSILFTRKRRNYDKYNLRISHTAVQHSQIKKQNNNSFIKREERKKSQYTDDIKIVTFTQKNKNVQFLRHRLRAEK